MSSIFTSLLCIHLTLLKFGSSITYNNPSSDITCGSTEDCTIICDSSTCQDRNFYFENTYPSPYKITFNCTGFASCSGMTINANSTDFELNCIGAFVCGDLTLNLYHSHEDDQVNIYAEDRGALVNAMMNFNVSNGNVDLISTSSVTINQEVATGEWYVYMLYENSQFNLNAYGEYAVDVTTFEAYSQYALNPYTGEYGGTPYGILNFTCKSDLITDQYACGAYQTIKAQTIKQLHVRAYGEYNLENSDIYYPIHNLSDSPTSTLACEGAWACFGTNVYSPQGLTAINVSCIDSNCYGSAEIYCGYRYEYYCHIDLGENNPCETSFASTTSVCFTGVSEPDNTKLIVSSIDTNTIDLSSIPSLVGYDVYYYNRYITSLESFTCNYGPLCVFRDDGEQSNLDNLIFNGSLTLELYLDNIVNSQGVQIYGPQRNPMETRFVYDTKNPRGQIYTEPNNRFYLENIDYISIDCEFYDECLGNKFYLGNSSNVTIGCDNFYSNDATCMNAEIYTDLYSWGSYNEEALSITCDDLESCTNVTLTVGDNSFCTFMYNSNSDSWNCTNWMSSAPSMAPTYNPTVNPTVTTDMPTGTTSMPSQTPSSASPSTTPSYNPSRSPWVYPSMAPTSRPSNNPSMMPSMTPSITNNDPTMSPIPESDVDVDVFSTTGNPDNNSGFRVSVYNICIIYFVLVVIFL